MNLLVVEMRRALRRRVVRVLILIALVGCAFAGVIAFLSSSGKTLAELHAGRRAASRGAHRLVGTPGRPTARCSSRPSSC